MPAQIFLFRHGETAWSLTGQHTGRTDLPLTANGEHLASQISERLQGVMFDHVLTSPLKRARQTCDLAGFGAVAREDPDLREWDYGIYEGWTTDEIQGERPAWNVFLNGCPGGEAVEIIGRRADRVVRRLRELDGKVAVFSHGQFLRVLAARWIGLPAGEGRHFALDTASISILGYEHSDRKVPAITLWNTVAGAVPATLILAPASR